MSGLGKTLGLCACTLLGAHLERHVPAQTPRLLDPQKSIFRAFPAADSYRVIERDVLASARRRIEKSVSFRVHFGELGRHSLYVALRGRQPLGMIYVQHEECDFGLAAFEWGMSFDVRTSSFHFQQARSPYRIGLERSNFLRSLIGLSSAELAALLTEQGRLRTLPEGVDPEAMQLATAVVRSGVKSMAVLNVVWGEEVNRLRDTSIGMAEFERCSFARRLWPAIDKRQVDGVRQDSSKRKRRLSYAIAAFDGRGQPLGVFATMQFGSSKARIETSWRFDVRQRVTKIDAPSSASPAMRRALDEFRGQELAELAKRPDEIGVAARELLRSMATAAAKQSAGKPKATPPK